MTLEMDDASDPGTTVTPETEGTPPQGPQRGDDEETREEETGEEETGS